MAKYRKKPIVIEAIRFEDTPECLAALSEFIDDQELHVGRGPYEPPKLLLETLEGMHQATLGDYIIKGIAGEFYPCKPDIFDATYERVEEDANERMAAWKAPLS